MLSLFMFIAVGLALGLAWTPLTRALLPHAQGSGRVPRAGFGVAGALVGGCVGAFGSFDVSRSPGLARLEAPSLLLSAVGACVALLLRDAARVGQSRRTGVRETAGRRPRRLADS